MHYRTEQEQLPLDPIDGFLKETSSKGEPQAKLTVTRTQLPSDLTVTLLEPRG
jgi:hypothetical protein